MNPKNKIVLFGASKAGETYLRKNTDLNIIAFVDNDAMRHGKEILGLPVLPPSALLRLTYDEVVITSLWVDAILTQLIDELGIERHKIHIPQKCEMKSAQPFMHADTLALGRQLLVSLSQFLAVNDIKACIDSGTLLGLMREGSLLTWDDDIDFAVDDIDFERMLMVMHNFHEHAPMRDKVDWHATVLNLSGVDVCLNIEFTPKGGCSLVPFETSLQRRKSINGRSELLSSAGIFYAPDYHFNTLSSLMFEGAIIPIPSQAEEFLTFMYGDWRTPKKSMALNDYDNRRSYSAMSRPPVSITKRSLW